MRDVISKGLTKEEILNGSMLAFKGGWNKVKLYFMLGLPYEEEEDIKEIPRLANEIAALYYDTVPKEARQGRCQVTMSTSFFVPKPFTPFQWARMYPANEYLKRAKLVNDEMKEQLNKKSLKYQRHQRDQTLLEGIFARGDRRIGEAILLAYKNGAVYDAWSGFFDFNIWEEAFLKKGIDYEFYITRERDTSEAFPWDFIDIGVKKEFLISEWNAAKDAKVPKNCREACAGCGCASYGAGVCHGF